MDPAGGQPMRCRDQGARRGGAARRERHHHHLPRDAEAELRSAGPDITVEIDEPLYTEAETLAALRHFKPTGYDAEFEVAKGVTARFVDAGHILGSAIIIVRAGGRTLVFSGDLGRRPASARPTRSAVRPATIC